MVNLYTRISARSSGPCTIVTLGGPRIGKSESIVYLTYSEVQDFIEALQSVPEPPPLPG